MNVEQARLSNVWVQGACLRCPAGCPAASRSKPLTKQITAANTRRRFQFEVAHRLQQLHLPRRPNNELSRILARISPTTDHEVRFGLPGAVFGLILCFRSAPITELARGESRRPGLHGLRVETGARHRLALTLELSARRSRLKCYREHDAPWRRRPCMDSRRPWRT